jgi:transforming growth factor-beta-induced protein
VASTLGLLVAGTSAQTGTILDLGTLLAAQKNLTTFYGLIQVGNPEVWTEDTPGEY